MEIKVFDQQDKLDLFNELKRSALPYKVKIEPIFQKRTDIQNKYYYGVVVKMIAEYLGYYPDECHRMLLRMFAKLGEDEDEYGHKYDICESTSGMDTMRMEKYLEDIKTFFLTDFKLYIPNAGEQFEEEEIKEKIIYK